MLAPVSLDFQSFTSTWAHHLLVPVERRLKSRHIQFLALSGAIGTGLFVGSGQVISLSGPLSAFLAYLITGLNVYAVINSLGEMATYLPVPGAVSRLPMPRDGL